MAVLSVQTNALNTSVCIAGEPGLLCSALQAHVAAEAACSASRAADKYAAQAAAYAEEAAKAAKDAKAAATTQPAGQSASDAPSSPVLNEADPEAASATAAYDAQRHSRKHADDARFASTEAKEVSNASKIASDRAQGHLKDVLHAASRWQVAWQLLCKHLCGKSASNPVASAQAEADAAMERRDEAKKRREETEQLAIQAHDKAEEAAAHAADAARRAAIAAKRSRTPRDDSARGDPTARGVPLTIPQQQVTSGGGRTGTFSGSQTKI